MEKLKDINQKYQREFLDSTARYPALIAGIGTGKTMCAIIKVVMLAECFPGNLIWVVRSTVKSLHDSTVKDFERYTGRKPDSKGEMKWPNGSVIVFRHGEEINTSNLQNVNLGAFYLEQAEEMPTENVFLMLTDRLRRDTVPIRQGIIIANANGHNWVWRMWINNPISDQYRCWQASTFDNESNLPADFIEDKKLLEKIAPNHYRRLVLNLHDVEDEGDQLFPTQVIEDAKKNDIYGFNKKIIGLDVARYGDDRSVLTMIQQSSDGWEQKFVRTRRNISLMEVTGWTMDAIMEFKPDLLVVDDSGLGGGVVDRLREQKITVDAFISNNAIDHPHYKTRKDMAYFKLREMMDKKQIKILDNNEQDEDLSAIRFSYRSDMVKFIRSKEELRKKGIRSPDLADTLMMVVSGIHSFPTHTQYKGENSGYKKLFGTEHDREILIQSGGYGNF